MQGAVNSADDVILVETIVATHGVPCLSVTGVCCGKKSANKGFGSTDIEQEADM